jgi:formylglycine-generating enzyme required for sulfatase activity/predicted DNA-binding protein (UPF0251 family)
VARQTASDAKKRAVRRRVRERQVMDMPEPQVVEPVRSHEVQYLLDQELSRLPDKYRIAVVVCDLEGMTLRDAARQLKIPQGTLASRLRTARTMLTKRLAKHGLTASGGSVAAGVSHQTALASVPASVLCSTIKAVTLVAAGEATATGLISANVAVLTEGVVKSMLLTKIKKVMALLLMLSMVMLTSAMLLAWSQTGDNGNSVEKPDKQAAQQKDPKKDPRKYFTNSIAMKFGWIPPGTFMMGSPNDEKERYGNETQHKVTLTKGFYMGVNTVTQEQWQAVMGNNPSKFKGEKNLPVELVSWDDCQEFIKKLRAKDNKSYRLPTEAEWEYACRAGTTTPFHFGETISTDQANYNGRFTYGIGEKGVIRGKTTPVGSFPANAWGLHDMHGNVWQWCQDWEDDYPQKDVVDPQGPNMGTYRLMRGGSWRSTAGTSRSAYRAWHDNGDPGPRYDHVGFRICFFVE